MADYNLQRFLKWFLLVWAALLTAAGLWAQTPGYDPDMTYATELLKPGVLAPDFTLEDLNGHAVNLKDFRNRTTVLIFWASWCPDCRAEVPLLREMYASSDPSKVVFVSVSFDRDKEVLKAYANENALPGVQLFDPAGKKKSKVAEAYHVKWIPSLYLIDANGKILLSTVVADKVSTILKD